MNLIEQLGGYQKAKEWYDENTDKEWVGIYHMPKLYSALLEYRRENNIFEFGDVVVMRGTSHYDICEFVEVSKVLPAYMLKDENGCKFGINKKCVDHATDEEIKVGHRK